MNSKRTSDYFTYINVFETDFLTLLLVTSEGSWLVQKIKTE